MQEVNHRFASGTGFALATINLDHLVKLSASETFRTAYSQQDLVVADGHPIVWLSHLARTPVELLPGSELIEPLAARAAAGGVTVALVGATDAVLHSAAHYLEKQNPGLRVVAKISPAMGFDPEGPEADAVFSEIDASGARLVFLAFGAPKQEILAARGREVLPSVGFASIGAGLDFLAGSQVRAPEFMRNLAMEWLWRLMANPRRMTMRYLKCLVILPKQTVQALRQRIDV
ncbi:WecB/TagA/CpsF family glycosyltransferase [Primorskyibacter sp. S187A]|uniref:WecB/TagA/CpsF family glycosyltransferase n=1 Tax=Primorskyibacter sp. S187A TaxID=3415130 RepID=UPI003C7E4227